MITTGPGQPLTYSGDAHGEMPAPKCLGCVGQALGEG